MPVCWRKTETWSTLARSMPVLSPSSQPTGPPQPQAILPSANQHYASTVASVNDFGIVEFALYTLKVHYTAWGLPQRVMGDLASIVHHQNGRSKCNVMVAASALVGVPVLCATGYKSLTLIVMVHDLVQAHCCVELMGGGGGVLEG